MMGALKTGEWLTHDRVRRIVVICLIVSLASLVLLFATAHGTLDWKGRPIGTDYSEVYAAGRMAWDGAAANVWDWPTHFKVQQGLHHSRTVDLYGWHYPPPFLFVAMAIASLPYIAGLVVWQAATLGPFTLMIRRITGRRDTWLFVLAAPVTLICLTHGHNGFLTGLLLGGGLMLLDRRPFAAGLLFGCLVYKPQFALLIPLLLLVTLNWRAILGAALSSLGLVALTFAMWGWDVWQAFFDSLPLTRHVVIDQGRTGWHKIMSAFSFIRSWGGSIAFAYAVQALVTTTAIAITLWLARSARPALRNAAVSAAVLLSTPYVLDYDFVVLGLGIAWLWRDGEEHGFGPWERTLLAFAWVAPLFARAVAEHTLIPVGWLSAVTILALALLRSSAFRASPSRRSRAASAP